MGCNQFTYGVQGTAGGRGWSIASGKGEGLVSGKVNFRVLVVFLSQDTDMAKTSGLAECAKAVNKTNLGSRLLMLTCMKPRLLRLQKAMRASGE